MEKCLDCGGASFLGADVKNKLWHYWAVPACGGGAAPDWRVGGGMLNHPGRFSAAPFTAKELFQMDAIFSDGSLGD